MADRFLDAADAERADRTLRKLRRHEISGWALAGGLALEIQCAGDGAPARRLNDIDLVAPGFEAIPRTLAADFLMRHVHPLDPPGKTILQMVDAETAVRIDVFGAYGGILARTREVDLPWGRMPVVSREDMLARGARLLMDLRQGIPTEAKHAQDYLRLAHRMRAAEVEAAWQDHRKRDHPATFDEANRLVAGLMETRGEALVAPEYSRDAAKVCARCVDTEGFPLADRRVVLAVLGYC